MVFVCAAVTCGCTSCSAFRCDVAILCSIAPCCALRTATWRRATACSLTSALSSPRRTDFPYPSAYASYYCPWRLRPYRLASSSILIPSLLTCHPVAASSGGARWHGGEPVRLCARAAAHVRQSRSACAPGPGVVSASRERFFLSDHEMGRFLAHSSANFKGVAGV